MTEANQRARIALGVIAVVLALACGYLLLGKALFPGGVPGSWTAADKAADREVAVTSAARTVTLAFLDVDYQNMDPLVQKVLDLSTGTFKKQYDATKVNLEAAAREGKATSVGTIKDIGISDIDADSAIVFVAADSQVDNAAMAQARAKGQAVDQNRYYRFQLNMTKVGDHWLLNELQILG